MDKHPLRESETVELKKSLAETKQGLISIVAILNKHQAGTLWFGVRHARYLRRYRGQRQNPA